MRTTRTVPIVGIDLESDPVARGWCRKSWPSWRQPYRIVPRSARNSAANRSKFLKKPCRRFARLGVLWDSTIGEGQFQCHDRLLHVKPE